MNGAETMAWSRHQHVARGYLSKTHPTTNPFLTNSKKSDDRNVLQTHINTVEDRTFPTVHAATPRALYNGILCGAKIEVSSLII